MNIHSLIKNTKGSPLRLVVITDAFSIFHANKVIKNAYLRHVAENAIRINVQKRFLGYVGTLQVDYVDLQSIADHDRGLIYEMRNCTTLKNLKKYGEDLFYLVPFYPAVFSKFEKIIMMDHDLQFFTSIEEVWELFSEFSSSAIMGIALDLQPHYYLQTAAYRKENPNSNIGLPGLQQGFNTGLVLFNLEAMRRSELWKRYTTPGNLCPLIQKYHMNVIVGDQDFINAVGFESPELIHVLPCQFNAQISVQMDREPNREIFRSFHHCEPPHYIIHRNGCGPTKADCDKELSQCGLL